MREFARLFPTNVCLFFFSFVFDRCLVGKLMIPHSAGIPANLNSMEIFFFFFLSFFFSFSSSWDWEDVLHRGWIWYYKTGISSSGSG
ncbi:hypothetical protein QBC43DRAFT_310209 [Cladorrhinum sp. PSN259]|nr:hypothetical protein QBC43DRAFT_310209 [Cladorrhinum sp. PSN259]